MRFRTTPQCIQTLVGKSTRIEGNITSSSAIRIEGNVEGEIVCTEDVVVGETARIKGNISGKNVTISGEVNGNIDSKGAVEMTATATVIGDISAISLTIAGGAVFQGTSRMKQPQKDRSRERDEHLTNPGHTES